MCALFAALSAITAAPAWTQAPAPQPAPVIQEQGPKSIRATGRFAERVEKLVQSAPVDKGEWGLLVVDAATDENSVRKKCRQNILSRRRT